MLSYRSEAPLIFEVVLPNRTGPALAGELLARGLFISQARVLGDIDAATRAAAKLAGGAWADTPDDDFEFSSLEGALRVSELCELPAAASPL